MIDLSKVIRVIRQPRKSGGPRIVYELPCAAENCTDLVRVRKPMAKKSNGLCKTHSHIKRPFESIYNGLFRDHRGTKVELTYEEFCKLAEIKECHYCGCEIKRNPYATVKGKFFSRAHFLDKKNTKGPYSCSNCVVCCTRCNKLRSDKFSYEEFLLIGQVLKVIESNRRQLIKSMQK